MAVSIALITNFFTSNSAPDSSVWLHSGQVSCKKTPFASQFAAEWLVSTLKIFVVKGSPMKKILTNTWGVVMPPWWFCQADFFRVAESREPTLSPQHQKLKRADRGSSPRDVSTSVAMPKLDSFGIITHKNAVRNPTSSSSRTTW